VAPWSSPFVNLLYDWCLARLPPKYKNYDKQE